MSLAGYLSQGKPGDGDLRMPDGPTDAVGAEYAGDVLSGKISVEQGQRMADAGASLEGLLQRLGLKAGPRVLDQCCSSTDEYDPVLRWHCRL